MKQLAAWIAAALLLAASITGLVLLSDYAGANPFRKEFFYDYPVYATADGEGNVYVIDTSLRRVSRIGAAGVHMYNIDGGVRDGSSFFYANQIAVNDEGYLFVLDELRDEQGFYVQRERILLYSPGGKLLGTLKQIDYPEGLHDPSLVQRTRIIALEPRGDSAIDYYRLTEDGLAKESIDFNIDGELSVSPDREIAFYPFPQALLYIADVTSGPQGALATLRNGQIVELSADGSRTVLFDAADHSELIVPWELDADSEGRVYFIDLEARALRNLSGDIVLDRDIVADATETPDLYEYDYYRMAVGANDKVYIPIGDGNSIVEMDRGGEIRLIDMAVRRGGELLQDFAWWASLAGAVIALFWLLWLVYARLFNKKLPRVLVSALAVVVLVAGVGTLSSFLLIDNFNGRYTDVIFKRISQMIQIFPRVIDGDEFARINSQADFGNDAYMKIRSDLLDAFNENKDDWNKGYYFALYRIIDGRLYGFMYMNGAINMYYPFDWLSPDDPGVYDLAAEGQIATEMITDISGDWIYGVGPIYDSAGNVVGLFETGTDLYTLTLENRKLIRDLIWELITVWIILMLLLVEITVLNSLLRERRNASVPLGEKDTGFSDGNLARPLVFLYFTAVSFSIAFLPLLSRDLYVPLGNLSMEMVIALPLSLEMAFFGIATMFTGLLTQQLGWRPIFSVSLLISIVGLLLSALSRDLMLFLVARSLTGLGSGMGYIALRSFINLEGRKDKRNAAYSHFYSGMIAGINVGLVLGASLAGIVGFSNVFFIAVFLMLVTTVVFSALYRQTPYFWKAPALSDMGHRSAIVSLIKNPRLWVYFILLLLPTYVAASYVSFYFPLFAASMGLTTPQIGRFMIMNGLFIVYLGPPLSRFIEKRIGNYWGSILGSLLWGGALVFAAINGSIIIAIISLVLMGLTEGFAVSSQNGLYFHQKVVARAGEDRATGYFELIGKVGETLGPIVFAGVLLMGHQKGLMLLGIIVAVMAVPYLLFIRNRGEGAEK